MPHVVLAINSAIAASTGKSPHQLLYGQHVATATDLALDAPATNVAAEDAATRAVQWATLAQRAIARAQQQQKTYYDRHRVHQEYAVGDRVLLSSRHLPLEDSKKLAQRWLGPFLVEGRVGSSAYRLQLPQRWSAVHPVFHVSLLRRWGGRMSVLPPLLLVDGTEEWKVEAILGHQESCHGRQYVVRFKGYGPEED